MTTESRSTFAIVGGGLAAAEAAKTLRAQGFVGRLVLIAGEGIAPYDRPPLSKGYLRGEDPLEKLFVLDDAFYREGDVELLTGRTATDLDVRRRVVGLDDGGEVRFDRLLIATGARARVPELPGVDLPFAHFLRTVADADRLRNAARGAESAVVVGGGWIAGETAASLRQLGLSVTLVVPGEELLAKHLGAELGRRFAAVHEANGVSIVRGRRAVALVDDAVRGVRLDDGGVISGDLVVLGLGAVPNDELAGGAGLPVEQGILVDEHLATAADGIYAAGDVASAWHPRYRRVVRSEHWDNARRQGRLAARSMLGQSVSYDRVPFLYSDQFDLGIELVGRVAAWDRVVLRDIDDGRFLAGWLRGRELVAAMHANVWDAKKPLDALVAARAHVDAARFADPDVPLETLTHEAAAA